MGKQFEYITNNDPFVIHQSGTRLTDIVECEHHETGFVVVLFGQSRSAPGPQRIDTAIGRCNLADLFGSIQAQILHHEGEAALKAFQESVAHHTHASHTALKDIRAQHRDCCEAAFRTGGREHTCQNEAGRD